MLQAKSGHHLCQVWGRLMGVTMQAETGHCFCFAWVDLTSMPRPAAAFLTFVDLSVSLYLEPKQAALEEALLGEFDGAGFQGICGVG